MLLVLLPLWLFLVGCVSAHYRFTSLISPDGTVTDAYEYVRKNTNDNSPVVDVTSDDMRCNTGATNDGADAKTLDVKTGDTVGFMADNLLYHQGPVDVYLGQAPDSASSWDGSGKAWFKIFQIGPEQSDNGLKFDVSIQKVTFTLPDSIPDAEYLLRIEHTALHAGTGKPEFYISCAQLKVSGGSSGSPSMVEIPGWLSADDPSLTVNIYNWNKPSSDYTNPGPAVYGSGTGSSSGGDGSGSSGSGSGGGDDGSYGGDDGSTSGDDGSYGGDDGNSTGDAGGSGGGSGSGSDGSSTYNDDYGHCVLKYTPPTVHKSYKRRIVRWLWQA
ncbi:lytic polysaccharide monooxygenase [Cylindrobasidium torrendii FP15055 ss-10]|uniref:AA9 family lytic polysaccharide monooxygenase n=1 Tax=Cylindrobasidium torrendii FP15055 ss-10 TaxID=1314674 RepID=A0A0D7BGY3_9AGAR|nr:lytic polysaccharide monooxygenase [Cylindrobasidium torrendii FP15055 ss-10]